MVECGGLENRFARNPGNEGSNPSSSARAILQARQCAGPVFCFVFDLAEKARRLTRL